MLHLWQMKKTSMHVFSECEKSAQWEYKKKHLLFKHSLKAVWYSGISKLQN